EITPMRQRVNVVVDLGIILDFAEVIPRVIKSIKRDAQAPDIILADILRRLFTQSLGAAVKTARGMPKRKIGLISLRKSSHSLRILFHQPPNFLLCQIA